MIFLVTFLTLVLDQLSKFLAPQFAGSLDMGLCRFIAPTQNTAGAFSVQLPNAILAGLTVFLLGCILVWVRKNPPRDNLEQISLGLILGGGMGNLLDRLLQFGVVDFISCTFWPVFNLADMAITTGVMLLFIVSLSKSKTKKSL